MEMAGRMLLDDELELPSPARGRAPAAGRLLGFAEIAFLPVLREPAFDTGFGGHRSSRAGVAREQESCLRRTA